MTMSVFTLGLFQQAIYWAPTGVNGFGKTTYAAPILISCRWQDKATLFRSPEGKEMTSESVVYVDRQLSAKGMLMNSSDLSAVSSQNPSDITGSSRPREIRGLNSSPAIDASMVSLKVFL